MAADTLDGGVGADDHAGLRAAEELVTREAHDRGARVDRAARGRLVGQVGQVEQLARAEVVHERRPCLAARAASSSSRGEAVKPTMRKFDWCTRTSAAVSGPIAAS